MNEKEKLIPQRRFKEFKNTGTWEHRTLGDITEVITKGTTPLDKSWKGPVNYVKTDSIDSQFGHIIVKANTSIEEHERYLKRSQLKAGDVLFSIVGTLGRVGIVQEKDLPANTNQQIAIIRLNKGDNNYVFNALKTSRVAEFIKSDATIGAQPSLSLWQIEKLIISYPGIKEQIQIGKFFNQLDNTIALYQRKLDKAKSLKSAYLLEMFPADGERKPKRRFAGFTDDWEQSKLDEVVKSHNAGVYIAKEKYGAGTNVIGVGNIYGGDSVDGEIYRLGPVADEKYILDENDLIYGESSLVPEGIARTMYVTKNGAGTAFAWHTRRVKINTDICNAHVLTLELNYNKEIRNYLISVSTQTALTGITTDGYFNTVIYYPSLAEQDKISSFFTKLDNLINVHQRKLEKLQNIKKAYLNEMFV